LKDTALSKFRNLAKENNGERLKRIMKLNPNAEHISDAILAFEDVEAAI